jgi:hypothetical protein
MPASCNKLSCDGHMPILGREVERRAPFLVLKIDLTVPCNERFRDCIMPEIGRVVERREPLRVLVVDEGLRIWRRQQPSNRHCIALYRYSAQLLSFHS